MSMKTLLNQKYYGRLQNGKYEVKINAFPTYTEETASSADFCTFPLVILAGNGITEPRPYKRTLFETDMTYFLSGVRAQLNREHDDIKPWDFIKELVTNKTTFNIWLENKTITKADGTVKDVQNLYYREPRTTVTTAPEIE